MDPLFNEFTPGIEIFHGNNYIILLNLIGLILISTTFMIIGVLCVVLADSGIEKKTKKAVLLTKVFGLFLISCSFARLIDIISFWHNYPIFNGWIRVITGLLALFAIFMIPGIIKEAKSQKTINQVRDTMDETNKKIDDLNDLNKKYN